MSKKETKGLVTKESICATGGLFACVALFILCTRSLIFGDFGAAIHGFLTGVFGYCAYPLFLAIVYLCVTGLFGKRFIKDRWLAVCVTLTCVLLALIIHSASTVNWSMEDYVYRCFKSGENLSTVTFGGWLGGIIVFGVSKIVTQTGALVFFISLTLISVYVCVKVAKREKKDENKKEKKSKEKTIKAIDIPLSQPVPAQNVTPQAQIVPQPVQVQPQVQQFGAAQPQTQGQVQAQANAFPYANAVQQPQMVNAGAPVTPTVFSAAEEPSSQANYAGNMMPTVTQRPGVSLSENQAMPTQAEQGQTAQPVVPSAFSPFGNAQTMPITDRSRLVFEKREGNDERNEYDTSNPRGFLFGGSPADNFRRNLLFDPNARVNNMPVTEQPNGVGGTSGFMPSYADAYQNSINENTQTSRAVNPLGERTFGADFTQPRNERTETPSNVTPAVSFERETRQTDGLTQTLFGDSAYRLDVAEERGAREEINFSRESSSLRETTLPTAREENAGSYSRHDYKDLFSLSNPNVFGRVEEDNVNPFNADRQPETSFERDYGENDFSVRARRVQPFRRRQSLCIALGF